MINFRYDHISELGAGATGEVILVGDRIQGGRKYAMKIFRQDGGSNLDEQLFRNEISTLLQLEHPNLVTMHDFGVVRHSDSNVFLGRRFLVMEFVEGMDALTWLGEVQSSTVKVPVIESLLLQALSVLDYIHQEGIIHFDIKPGNLLLENLSGPSVPRLKLTDFGFSTRHEPSVAVPLRGTLQYTAPELLQGLAHDHRADLYSLGVTFYHILEGRNPFHAADPVEAIKQILNETPGFSSIENYPAALVETVQGLMERDPALRFRSGKEAAKVLVREKSVSISSYFSERTGFVGRTQERKQIEDAMLRLGKGNVGVGRAVFLISGGEGIGKTALLRKLVKVARLLDLLVVQTTHSPLGSPLSAILFAIGQLQVHVQSFSTAGGSVVRKYSSLLADMASLREAQAFSSKPLEDRENLVGMLARFMVECSTMFPFVIVADDVDKIDAVSADVLRAVACEDEDGRILILASQSREEAEIFPTDLWNTISLPELEIDDVSALGQMMVGPLEISEDVGRSIHELYGGIPAVLVQAFRALSNSLSQKDIEDPENQQKHIATIIDDLPLNVGELLARRYNNLDKERQLLVDLVSCFRHPVPKEGILLLVPFERGRTLAHLHSLESEGLLTSVGAGISLRLKALQKFVYDSLEEKSYIHARLAEVLEKMRTPETLPDLQELAHQFLASGNLSKASDFAERGADMGVDTLAFQEAAELYEQALATASAAGESERVVSIKAKLSHALMQGGRFNEALALAQEVSHHYSPDSTICVSLKKTIGVSASRLGDYETARMALLEALNHSLDDNVRMEVQQEMIGIELNAGNYDVAERQCYEQLQFANLSGDEKLAAAVYTDLGIVAFHQDRFDEAVSHFGECADRYRKIGNQIRVANALINIGNVLSAKGDHQRAIEDWDAALWLCRDYGTLYQQAQIQNNMGIAHFKLKNHAKARECYSQARNLFQRVASKSGFAYVLTNLGDVCFAEGQYEASIAVWTEARGLYTSMGDGRGLVETGLQLAQASSVVGEMPEAVEYLRKARSGIDECKLSTFEGQWQYVDGLVKCAMGDHESAMRSFRKALECFESETEPEKPLLVRMRAAQCHIHENSFEIASNDVMALLQEKDIASFPHILAEAYYSLGVIASGDLSIALEKPVVYYRKGS